MREVTKQAENLRGVVAEDIELQDLIMHRVEVIMGGEPFGGEVVGRMLDGGEVEDGLLLWDDDDAAWVLAGGALDALAARGEVGEEGRVHLADLLLRGGFA